MPRINLLPAKRLQREEALRQELRIAVLVLVGTLLCLFTHERAQAASIAARQQQLVEVQQVAESYASKMKQIDEFKGALKRLSQKVATIDALRADKSGPSQLLGMFAEVFSNHPRVWLSRLEQSGSVVRLSGNAMSQEDISRLQMDLSKHTPLLRNVSLELVNAAKSSNDRVLEWKMVCALVASQEHP